MKIRLNEWKVKQQVKKSQKNSKIGKIWQEWLWSNYPCQIKFREGFPYILVQGRLDFKTPEVYDLFKKKTTKIWIKIKLSLQNKISRGIPLYIEQGRLDLETLEVLKTLMCKCTLQSLWARKSSHSSFNTNINFIGGGRGKNNYKAYK